MTDTNTKDTKTTVEQIIRIIKEGCNFVRINPGNFYYKAIQLLSFGE